METLVNARMHRRNFQKLALALALPAPLALAALGVSLLVRPDFVTYLV